MGKKKIEAEKETTDRESVIEGLEVNDMGPGAYTDDSIKTLL